MSVRPAPSPPAARNAGAPGAGRATRLRLALAALWLLDAVLQLEPSHFSADFFGSMLRSNMSEPPGWLWDLGSVVEPVVTAHAVLADALCAALQLGIALGLLFRRTARLALAVSVPWSICVWLFGEAAGGLFGPGASALTGAPGAALIYCVVALVLWPKRGPSVGASIAVGGGVGGGAGGGVGGGVLPAQLCRRRAHQNPGAAAEWRRALVDLAWVALWVGTAALESDALNRLPMTAGSAITAAGIGEPAPLAGLNTAVGGLVGQHGVELALVAGLVQAAIGLGILLPRTRRLALAAGIAVGLLYGVVGQDLGGIFSNGLLGVLTSGSTDPGTGPIITIFALALWPGPRAEPGPQPVAEPVAAGLARQAPRLRLAGADDSGRGRRRVATELEHVR